MSHKFDLAEAGDLYLMRGAIYAKKKNLIEKKDLIDNIKKITDYGNKIKAYKDSLKIIKRWNFLTGPTKHSYETKLNKEFDDCIKRIKDSKKDYLNNKEKHIKQSLENKKSLLANMKTICDQECKNKVSWIKKIKSYEKYKEKLKSAQKQFHDPWVVKWSYE